MPENEKSVHDCRDEGRKHIQKVVIFAQAAKKIIAKRHENWFNAREVVKWLLDRTPSGLQK